MTRNHSTPGISASHQQDNSTINIASLIQVTLYKETKDVKAGVTLTNDGLERVVVKKSPNSFYRPVIIQAVSTICLNELLGSVRLVVQDVCNTQ